MSHWTNLVGLLLLPQALGASLLVSHYTGKIFSVSYTAKGANNASMAVTASIAGCGTTPAWLHITSDAKTVYCIDEDWNGSGVVASYSVGASGALTQMGQLASSGASVHGTPFGGSNGAGFIATVEYDPSTLTTYKLPLATSPLQKLKFTMASPGPNPRQNAPHPHAAHVDPTGNFLLVPDLGADLIRIFAIDSVTGNLTACAPAVTSPGDGPRHATWWTPTAGSTAGLNLYTVNELGNSVSSWKAIYPTSTSDGCLSLTKKQTLSTYAKGSTPPTGSKASEVHVSGNFLYAANRADQTFGKQQDSLATYAINAASGDISWVEATNSHAWFPRTFSINKAGDLVAVGGQTSSNIAVVRRDVKTGRLGSLVASIPIATPGREQQEDGLSAVVWVEQ